MKGIRKHGRNFRVDTTVKGWRIVQGGFATEAAAKAWQYHLRTSPDALDEYLGRKLQGPRITVAQVLTFYWDKHSRKLRAADRYEDHARHLTASELGEMQAADIRQRHVEGYVDRRSCGPKTAFNELAYLRSALTYAWRNDRLRERPRFKLSRPKCERKRVAWPEEARRLVEAADLSMRRVVVACYSMGLRRGEVLAAQWSWVHDRHLLLPASVTKTGESATVEIPRSLWALLQESPVHPESLFCRTDARGKPRPWKVRTLHRQWTLLCERCGIGDLWLHDLRRSMASVGQSRGHSSAAVQANGRWQDAGTMARHYSHASAELVGNVGEDLAGLLLGSAQPQQQQPVSSEVEYLRGLVQQMLQQQAGKSDGGSLVDANSTVTAGFLNDTN
jgi:integrase